MTPPLSDGTIKASLVGIVTGSHSTVPEAKAAEMLRARITKRSRVDARIVSEENLDEVIRWADLVFCVGSGDTNRLSWSLMEELGAEPPCLPNSPMPHPEGFVVKSGRVRGKPFVVIAGVDDRGTIYGVGWVLRHITFSEDHIELPRLDAREKPAFRLRGGNPNGPGSLAREFGNLRPQTREEELETLEDLLLLGVNIMYEDAQLLRSYGMMSATTASRRAANEMPKGSDGSRRVPKEWAADGGSNDKLLCPSVPEAKKALLESFDESFGPGIHHDVFFIKSGDPGGCNCTMCRPWGRTYIMLVRDIAEILHRHDPDCTVIATNQDLTGEDNQALFDYLNSNESGWLHAIAYGPGSDEMQTYYRGPVTPRWFEYEGLGRLGNYLKHMHHELPGDVAITLFSDITHWMQAQYGVDNPDPALAAVFGRRTWNARPRHLHRIGREILHYAEGDMPYSEGMHDDFNKWFWCRMLWDPNQSAEEVTGQYCRYWFGPRARDEMVQAIMLMEETLERPVRGNTGIPRAVELVRSAGGKVPRNLMEQDYRWRIIAQKALMDLYLQLKLKRGDRLKALARPLLEAARKAEDPRPGVEEALSILIRPKRTKRMGRIKAEALRLGEESNRIIGYRVPACFTIDNLDMTELDWWAATLRKGLSSGEDGHLLNSISIVLDYENPGPGGQYDQLGWFSRPESLVCAGLRWMLYPFEGPARLAHYGLAYPDPRKSTEVTLVYDGLRRDVQYRLRLLARAHTKGCWPEEETGVARASIRISGRTVAEGLVLGGNLEFHELDIPHDLTESGRTIISLVTDSGPPAMAGLCEVWLMERGNIPWDVC